MRLIDADALIVSEDECRQKKDCRKCKMFVRGCEDLVALIEDAPTIEERKTGRWLQTHRGERGFSRMGFRCDQCGEVNPRSNYCPSCGAKMEDTTNG